MYNLNFHSYVESFPRGVRKVTAVELFDNNRLLDKTLVVLNPKEQDNKALGQKYAMKKLVSFFASREDLKVRRELWELFRHYSHACSKIMGD